MISVVGGRPQTLINAQAMDAADVVVALFDSRLGTSTGVDVSGTAEEINRAVDLGQPVHVYFSEEELPRVVDAEQLVALRAFQPDLQTRGLTMSCRDPRDLTGQVISAIERDIDERGREVSPLPLLRLLARCCTGSTSTRVGHLVSTSAAHRGAEQLRTISWSARTAIAPLRS